MQRDIDVEQTEAWLEWRAGEGRTATQSELDFVRTVGGGFVDGGYVLTPLALEWLARAARTRTDDGPTAETEVLALAALQACRRSD